MIMAAPWRLHYAEPDASEFATEEARTSMSERCHLHPKGLVKGMNGRFIGTKCVLRRRP